MSLVDPAVETPLVTVVVAAHNAEDYIEQSLSSLLSQTLRDLEIIVVDDASTDSTAEKVRSFQDPRIRLISLEANVGPAAARNAAIERARGSYLAILDADDVSRSQRLETQVRFLRSHPEIGVVGSQIRVIDERGGLLGFRRYPQDPLAIDRALRRWNPLAHSSVMARTDLVRRAGGYDGRVAVCHDYDLWCRLAIEEARFANLPCILIDYRIHASSIKTKRLKESIERTLAVQTTHWAHNASATDRAYWLSERVLLRLPASFVGSLFVVMRYKAPVLLRNGCSLLRRSRTRAIAAHSRRGAT
jgi:glycosyltransferase involved in cell wall biosynthesis